MSTRTTADRIMALYGVVAVGAFDRLTIAPLLAPIAHGLHATLPAATLAATAYLACYGLAQAGHGWLSDRIGRRRALRAALAMMAVASAASALAPAIGVFIAGRAVAGAASGGLVPGALVLLADHPGPRTARRQAALISALGAGTGLAAVAGLAGGAGAWRIVFAVTAVACAALIGPVPRGNPGAPGRSTRPRVTEVARRPEVRFLALAAVPEGAAVFGFILFFPPALAHLGQSAPIAALSTAAIGAGMLLGGMAVRPLTGKLSDRTLIAAGAALLAAGYAVTTAPNLPTLLTAAALVGIGQSALHATLQRWATQAAPDARGTSTALFATGTFVGAGAAALLGAILPSQFTALFITAAACAAVSGLIAARYRRPADGTTTLPPGSGTSSTID